MGNKHSYSSSSLGLICAQGDSFLFTKLENIALQCLRISKQKKNVVNHFYQPNNNYVATENNKHENGTSYWQIPICKSVDYLKWKKSLANIKVGTVSIPH